MVLCSENTFWEVGTEWAARSVSVNASSTRPGFRSVKFTGVRTFEVRNERMKLNKLESYPTHKNFSKRLGLFEYVTCLSVHLL